MVRLMATTGSKTEMKIESLRDKDSNDVLLFSEQSDVELDIG